VAAATPRTPAPAINPLQEDLVLLNICLSLCLALGLKHKPYAIVGGLALRLLGSTTPLTSIQLLVSNEKDADEAASNMAATDGFYYTKLRPDEPHQLYFRPLEGPPLSVDVIPVDDQRISQAFPEKGLDLRFVKVDSARIPVVVNPKLLLNYKCFSWRYIARGHDRDRRRRHDAAEIGFLLDYMKEKGIKASPGDVKLANSGFIAFF
jgi:hypothetical protein